MFVLLHLIFKKKTICFHVNTVNEITEQREASTHIYQACVLSWVNHGQTVRFSLFLFIKTLTEAHCRK